MQSLFCVSDCIAALLLEHKATLFPTTPYGYTPLHLAATHGAKRLYSALQAAGADIHHKCPTGRTAEDLLSLHSPTCSDGFPGILPTAIITHPKCLEHHTCPPALLQSSPSSAPPENVRRLAVLLDERLGVLRCRTLSSKLLWNMDPPSAVMADILAVHEWSYVRRIQHLCEGLSEDVDDAEGEGIGRIDADTSISKESFKAAMYAAGSTCAAVDYVVQGKARNVFCPIRPPGHHAGPRGVVKTEVGSDSNGFCLLNNVSIGAAYAMNRHRDLVKKVAIVDFDVHHGNGTEETVRWLRPAVDRATFSNDFSFGSVETARYKPWHDVDDADNVLFVSVHGFGPKEAGLEHLMPMAAFYPGTGKTVVPESLSANASSPLKPTLDRDSADVHPVKKGSGAEEESADRKGSVGDDSVLEGNISMEVHVGGGEESSGKRSATAWEQIGESEWLLCVD